MRSLLFVPGDSTRKFERALVSGADAIVLDLEDSVAEAAKLAARGLVSDFVAGNRDRPSRPLILVRINALDTPHWTADVAAATGAGADAIMLPKPRSGAYVTRLDAEITRLEALRGGPLGTTRIVAIATERAASLLAMASYEGASPRLDALAWGAEDLSAEIGARTSADEMGAPTSPFRLARDLCLIGAAAAGVAAIDQVYTRLGDLDGLAREALAAARDGFQGKMAIHPDQVAVINRAFTPPESEIAAARALVAAFEAHVGNAAGGVLVHDGRMVDAPHVARARRLLASAARHTA